MKKLILTEKIICNYIEYLGAHEKAPATVRKYAHDLRELRRFLSGACITKSVLIRWKMQLVQSRSPATVNAMLAALNGLMNYLDRRDLTVKPLKIQRSLFSDDRRELSMEDYRELVRAADMKNERISLIIQTICATGIRVSELRFITVEALKLGRAQIRNKGKLRVIFLPRKLCRLLKRYAEKNKKTVGAVFTTRTGKPVDRSNIWREMKKLCMAARVERVRVFPHNLRHLFARTYYAAQKDMTKLADILGHSNINTTRIYTAESASSCAKQIEKLGLVIT